MSSSRVVTLGMLCALAAAACAPNEPPEMPPLADELAQAFCTHQFNCCSLPEIATVTEGRYLTEAECLPYATLAAEAQVALLESALASGHISIRPRRPRRLHHHLRQPRLQHVARRPRDDPRRPRRRERARAVRRPAGRAPSPGSGLHPGRGVRGGQPLHWRDLRVRGERPRPDGDSAGLAGPSAPASSVRRSVNPATHPPTAIRARSSTAAPRTSPARRSPAPERRAVTTPPATRPSSATPPGVFSAIHPRPPAGPPRRRVRPATFPWGPSAIPIRRSRCRATSSPISAWRRARRAPPAAARRSRLAAGTSPVCRRRRTGSEPVSRLPPSASRALAPAGARPPAAAASVARSGRSRSAPPARATGTA